MTPEVRVQASAKPEAWHVAVLLAIFFTGLLLRLHDL
jgi:hypothetical protein